MARLLVRNDDVVVRLSWREALLARRKDVRVPLADVRGAMVEADWWRTLRGTAQHGRWRPERFCLGTWRHAGGIDFVAVRAPGPVAVVDLFPGRRFARLSVSTADPEGTVRAVRLAARWAREGADPPRGGRRHEPSRNRGGDRREKRSTRSA
ncbi:hypothetical protein [Streptomyces sp. NK15101]|uniref:hypothetical protein n=1 Tax=Streptomyces sp. NK15101 TaxID=2873261 RepID=UPI001CECE0AE|nr:hypothetical protein [Streptomyces sp. NK15101]